MIEYKFIKKTSKIEEIYNLYHENGWWDGNKKSAYKYIPKMIRGSVCYLVATDKNKVIGMGRAISDGISDAYIQDIAVIKDYRGKGIGKIMIKKIHKYLKKKNITWIALIAEPGTTHFYKKLGFSPMKNYTPMLGQQHR